MASPHRQDFRVQGCPKCRGTLIADKDEYGYYVYCFNCGFLKDVVESSSDSDKKGNTVVPTHRVRRTAPKPTTLTLAELKMLAARMNKKEVIAYLRVNIDRFSAMELAIPGALKVQYTYHCSHCPAIFSGKGSEGMFRGHVLNKHKGVQKKISVSSRL